MTRYAARTEVPVKRSRQQIETLLENHGAQGFLYGWNEKKDRIEFVAHELRVRMEMDRLAQKDFRSQRAYEQADRQRWRSLYLVIRAKLEAVESGLAVFEEEFLSFIVTGSGKTVGEILVPRLKESDGPIRSQSRLLAAVGEQD